MCGVRVAHAMPRPWLYGRGPPTFCCLSCCCRSCACRWHGAVACMLRGLRFNGYCCAQARAGPLSGARCAELAQAGSIPCTRACFRLRMTEISACHGVIAHANIAYIICVHGAVVEGGVPGTPEGRGLGLSWQC